MQSYPIMEKAEEIMLPGEMKWASEVSTLVSLASIDELQSRSLSERAYPRRNTTPFESQPVALIHSAKTNWAEFRSGFMMKSTQMIC